MRTMDGYDTIVTIVLVNDNIFLLIHNTAYNIII